MADKRMEEAVLEDCRIIFRNFSGKEGKYNRAGARNFNVLIPTDIATQMAKDGWNVRELPPRDETDEMEYRLEVAVNFSGRPPQVQMITSRGKTRLDEDTVDLLDWADIVNADLIIRPYQWEVNGKKGVKAYLKSLFVTIREDELELKYADVPDTAMNSMEFESDEEPPWED